VALRNRRSGWAVCIHPWFRYNCLARKFILSPKTFPFDWQIMIGGLAILLDWLLYRLQRVLRSV
jgi:hypothetical protein